MKNIEKAGEWFKRAKSNLVFAKIGFNSTEVLYEDLCFNAQQAAEKGLKALCMAHDIVFPKTHDLAYLIELLEKRNIVLPDELQMVKLLTDYAVETRYPGNYDPVSEDEFKTAIDIAEKILVWVEQMINSQIQY